MKISANDGADLQCQGKEGNEDCNTKLTPMYLSARSLSFFLFLPTSPEVFNGAVSINNINHCMPSSSSAYLSLLTFTALKYRYEEVAVCLFTLGAAVPYTF